MGRRTAKPNHRLFTRLPERPSSAQALLHEHLGPAPRRRCCHSRPRHARTPNKRPTSRPPPRSASSHGSSTPRRRASNWGQRRFCRPRAVHATPPASRGAESAVSGPPPPLVPVATCAGPRHVRAPRGAPRDSPRRQGGCPFSGLYIHVVYTDPGSPGGARR